MENDIIEKGSKLLGIPKTNVQSMFKDTNKDEAIKLLNDIESMSFYGITERLNLEDYYTDILSSYLVEIAGFNENISEEEQQEVYAAVFDEASIKAKEEFIKGIQSNNNPVKVKYHGKNITSKCSKLPHVPHYDMEDKTFCCGVNGDIELINYTIHITSVFEKIKGNKNRYSSVNGAYRISVSDNKR